MSFRFALERYIKDPDSQGDGIIYKDEKYVVIKDKFNKSVIHYLLLPRDKNLTKLNPLSAFEDDTLKKEVEKLIRKVKVMILERLQQEFGIEETEEFIKVGVHSVPSMANLHVHLLTKDMNSEKMKHKKHYNSFTTNFFVDFDELPLKADDKRFEAHAMEDLTKTSDLKCIYCGENFNNKFAQLKRHLTKEFEMKCRSKKRKIEVIEID